MMAQKAHLFGDDAVLGEIMQSRLPKQIKALGRKVQGFDSDVWGIKMSADQARKSNPLEWCGQNLPGFALMEVRVMLKSIN